MEIQPLGMNSCTFCRVGPHLYRIWGLWSWNIITAWAWTRTQTRTQRYSFQIISVNFSLTSSLIECGIATRVWMGGSGMDFLPLSLSFPGGVGGKVPTPSYACISSSSFQPSQAMDWCPSLNCARLSCSWVWWSFEYWWIWKLGGIRF